MAKKELQYSIDTETNCWLCINRKCRKDGYYEIKYKGKTTLAHRYAYMKHFGYIPEGLVVRHKCDNPSCINPEHLELGTQQDNLEDMTKRNRRATGSQCNHSNLTEKQIIAIREDNRLQKEIADDYNVSVTTISNIKNRKSWGWLSSQI